MNIRTLIILATFLVISSTTFAQYPHPSKVDLRFDRWYTFEELENAMHALAEAYPDLIQIKSLGKSVGGHDIWLLTMNNSATGPDTAKPAMYIDGNIHGNEIQAAEVVLYSIWYLAKSHGKIDSLTKLIDERAFYFVPCANPDGREYWFNQPSTPHDLRGGIRPVDNDYDGLLDEDPPDDLDGDGHITSMWAPDPMGRWKPDPDDKRFFIRVDRDDPPGGWTRLGQEGIDNDGDGQVNEDNIGGYDPNRNWPSEWAPTHVQRGSTDYPFSLPETRVIGEFMHEHPNIAAVQSYHNTGGMILRGPSVKHISYPRSDDQVHEELSLLGSKIIPHYKSLVTWKDLYTVYGGQTEWTYEGLGIASFTNELWTDRKMFNTSENPSEEDRRQFRDLLQFSDVYVPYREVDHPTYGRILVGGTTKYSSRVTPTWMQQEDLHRNFAFTMLHADHMPQVKWGNLQVRSGPGDLWEITAEVRNPKIIPTILQHARNKRIGNPDMLECMAGPGNRVVASGTVRNFMPWEKLDAQETTRPHRIVNPQGVGRKGNRIFRFLVEGEGAVELVYSSDKGGSITIPVELAPTPMADMTPPDTSLLIPELDS
ncbi:MAG: peptidase M14 [Phycisphaerae bacterium]|nr:peptidase M14 [Phycisphaerae bacterium]